MREKVCLLWLEKSFFCTFAAASANDGYGETQPLVGRHFMPKDDANTLAFSVEIKRINNFPLWVFGG